MAAAGTATVAGTRTSAGADENVDGGGPIDVLSEDIHAEDAAYTGPGDYVGPALESSFPFTHAALHWKASGEPVGAALRTSEDGEAWGAWQPLAVEAGPDDTPTGKTFTTLASAPRHRFVQYRLQPGPGITVTAVAVTVMNSVDGPASPSVAGAMAEPDRGNIPVTYTREDWGADEARRFDANGGERWPRAFVPHQKLVVHHTETRNTYSEEGAAADVRAIYAYHATTLGWGDIGYNALVDRFGNIYEGRYGREDAGTREVLSQGARAGHALRHNYGTCGIAVLGTHSRPDELDREGVDVPEGAYAGLVELLAFEAGRNGIDPEGAGDYALFEWRSDPLVENGWNRGLENICGHRDCQDRVCPGGRLYDLLPALRRDVAERLTPAGPDVALESYPDEDLHDVSEFEGFSATYAWNGDGTESGYEYALEAWRQTKPGQDDIVYLDGFTSDHRLAWSSTTSTSVSFQDFESGHYTFHVRALDGNGTSGTAARRTFLLLTSDEGTNNITVPGIARDGDESP